MVTLVRILVLILPLAASVGFGFLLAEGYVNLGGGEKDIVVAMLLALLSLVFIVCGLFTWRSRPSLGAWAWGALKVSMFILLAVWLLLWAWSVMTTL